MSAARTFIRWARNSEVSFRAFGMSSKSSKSSIIASHKRPALRVVAMAAAQHYQQGMRAQFTVE
jgi:hypothetical protein